MGLTCLIFNPSIILNVLCFFFSRRWTATLIVFGYFVLFISLGNSNLLLLAIFYLYLPLNSSNGNKANMNIRRMITRYFWSTEAPLLGSWRVVESVKCYLPLVWPPCKVWWSLHVIRRGRELWYNKFGSDLAQPLGWGVGAP